MPTILTIFLGLIFVFQIIFILKNQFTKMSNHTLSENSLDLVQLHSEHSWIWYKRYRDPKPVIGH